MCHISSPLKLAGLPFFLITSIVSSRNFFEYPIKSFQLGYVFKSIFSYNVIDEFESVGASIRFSGLVCFLKSIFTKSPGLIFITGAR